MEWVNVDLADLLKLQCFGGDVWDFRMNVLIAFLIPVIPVIVTFVFYRFKKIRLARMKMVSKSAQETVAGVLKYMFDSADYDNSGYIDMEKFMGMMRYARGVKVNYMLRDYTLLSERKKERRRETERGMNKRLKKAEKNLVDKIADLMRTFGAVSRRLQPNKEDVLCISRHQFLANSKEIVLDISDCPDCPRRIDATVVRTHEWTPSLFVFRACPSLTAFLLLLFVSQYLRQAVPAK